MSSKKSGFSGTQKFLNKKDEHLVRVDKREPYESLRNFKKPLEIKKVREF